MTEEETKTLQNGLQGRVFLERRSYRQRRIVDAARILPVVGLLLWFVPLVWPDADGAGAIKTSTATLYLFAIWVGLIVVGAFLAWKMAPSKETITQTPDPFERTSDEIQRTREIER